MTEVPLRDYVDARFTALEAVFRAELGAVQRAIELADGKLDARLAGMNEWRATIADRSEEFAKQVQVDALQKAVDTSAGLWKALVVGVSVLSIITLLLALGRLGGLVR